jgi:hypothetical protein
MLGNFRDSFATKLIDPCKKTLKYHVLEVILFGGGFVKIFTPK